MAVTITTFFQPVAAPLLLIQWTQEQGKKKPKHWLGRPWKVTAVNDGMIHASDNEQEPMEEPTCDNVQKPKLLYTVKQKNRIVADTKNHFIADVQHFFSVLRTSMYQQTDGRQLFTVWHTQQVRHQEGSR